MSAEIKNLSPQPVWGYFYDLTLIPRPTGHMEAVTRFMVAFGKGLGLETLQDEVGNVLIRKPASPGMEGHKTVTMQSHLDMVPQKNSSVKHDFLTDPIDAYIDGDWVKARETTLGADNGMGAAFAMAVLADKTLTHGPLEALFTINEEVGMDGAVGLKPGFLKGEILLNCDSEEEGELFVGCAGGADLNVSMQFKEDTYIPEGDVAVKISLTGLKGGHSGVDIHLGRANANKLMFRFLKEAVRDYGARLSSVDGGSLRNAIPREAFAVITIPGDNVEALWELVSDYQEMYRYEYKGIEHNINFTAEMTDMPATLIPEEIQDDQCDRRLPERCDQYAGRFSGYGRIVYKLGNRQVLERNDRDSNFGSQFVREPQGSCLFEFGKYFLSSRGEGGIFGWLRRMAAEYRFADPENHAASLFGFVRKEAGG